MGSRNVGTVVPTQEVRRSGVRGGQACACAWMREAGLLCLVRLGDPLRVPCG